MKIKSEIDVVLSLEKEIPEDVIAKLNGLKLTERTVALNAFLKGYVTEALARNLPAGFFPDSVDVVEVEDV